MRYAGFCGQLLSLALLALLAGCGSGQPSQSGTSPSPTIAVATYPLHVASDKRYLVDAAGRSFLVNGDAAWSLIVQLTRADADSYLEDRRQKGVNTVLVNLLEHHFATSPPKNAYGDAPFTTPSDFSKPNEKYFAHADYVIRKAAEKGMLVLLTPAYTGSNGGNQGWYQEMSVNGAAKLFAFGQYVGSRYKDDNNIVWVNGGDYNVPDKTLVQALANGIRSVDSKPHTYHGARGMAAMQYWRSGEPWLSVNIIYTDENTVVAAAFGEYNRSPAPFFLIEGRYEGSNGATEQTVRMQAYQTILSGGSGHLMGNGELWEFKPGWRLLLNSGGARSLAHLYNLFSTRPWWTLQPDQANSVLTSGVNSGADRAVLARDSNGSLAIAYVPTIRSITVDFSKLAGPKVRAQWFDPSNGAVTTISGSPFPALGVQAMRPAANNASNFGDWVLLLESTP